MPQVELVGILSALLALLAFVANQYNIWRNDNIYYDSFNFLSAVGLLYYAVELSAIPFIITNVVWGAVSGIDVARYFARGSKRVPKKRRMR